MKIKNIIHTALVDRWGCIDGVIAVGLIRNGGVGVDSWVLEGSGGGGLSAYLDSFGLAYTGGSREKWLCRASNSADKLQPLRYKMSTDEKW